MTGPNSSAQVREQLVAIGALSSALDGADIEFWLFGGWAVDFWVGSVTRPHEDIDVAAWRRDYESIATVLARAGWRHAPTTNDVVGTRFRFGAVEAEFTFIEPDGNDGGQIVIPFPGKPMVWSTLPFGNHRRELNGVPSRVIPLALLRAGKSVPRDGEIEGAKDRADHAALAGLVE